MIGRPGPGRRPMELALARGDRQVVDRGEATTHQAALVELPVLVAVGAEPAARIVPPFVGKTHGDPVAATAPQLLDEAVSRSLGPFSRRGPPAPATTL